MVAHKIIKIDKPGWRVYYDCDVRYPLCVVEKFDGTLPNAPIKRSEVGEPFRADVAIPQKYRMYWREYDDYMTYGGSPGHNAPASFHKTDLTDYRRTFLLSNICPQEVVFNGGRWLLLEMLCKEIVSSFHRTVILTGSVPAADTSRFGDTEINVPSHMYKVIIVTDSRGNTHSAAYLMPNTPGTDEVRIDKFVVSVEELSAALQRAAGFDINRIIGSVGGTHALPLERVHPLHLHLTVETRKLMRAARMNGNIVYAKTLKALERSYAKVAAPSKYHRLYRDRAEQRIRGSI